MAFGDPDVGRLKAVVGDQEIGKFMYSPSPAPALDKDEYIRKECLHMAINSVNTAEYTYRDILKAAKDYEQFVKRGF